MTNDLFDGSLSDEDIAAVFGVMAACPQHTFQVLTKRPARMRAWFDSVRDSGLDLTAEIGERPPSGHAEPSVCAIAYDHALGGTPSARSFCDRLNSVRDAVWPLPNVWLGVSVENQATADERIPLLLQTPAAVRFVSYEPALGAVDFRPFIHHEPDPDICLPECEGCPHGSGEEFGWGIPAIDWLIVGGESGPGARPFDLAWARSAIAQCREAGVPVFVKQLGARPRGEPWLKANGRWVQTDDHPAMRNAVILADRKGGDPSEWPEDLRVREFPT